MKHMNRAALFPPRCYVSRKPFVNGYRAESRYYFLYDRIDKSNACLARVCTRDKLDSGQKPDDNTLRPIVGDLSPVYNSPTLYPLDGKTHADG